MEPIFVVIVGPFVSHDNLLEGLMGVFVLDNLVVEVLESLMFALGSHYFLCFIRKNIWIRKLVSLVHSMDSDSGILNSTLLAHGLIILSIVALGSIARMVSYLGCHGLILVTVTSSRLLIEVIFVAKVICSIRLTKDLFYYGWRLFSFDVYFRVFESSKKLLLLLQSLLSGHELQLSLSLLCSSSIFSHLFHLEFKGYITSSSERCSLWSLILFLLDDAYGVKL